jgi:hypothetical protein
MTRKTLAGRSMICDDDCPGLDDFSHDVWPPDQRDRKKLSILIACGFPQEIWTEAASLLHRFFRGSGKRKRVGLSNYALRFAPVGPYIAARLCTDKGLV